MKRLLVALTLAFVCSCSHAGPLIGEWRSDPIQWIPPNQTNRFEVYATVTFLKDGSFQMHNFVDTQPPTELPAPMKGTYKTAGTNHIVFEFAPNDAFPSNKVPITVSFTISGDELTLPTFNTSVVQETRKYRRVKK